MEFKTKHLPHKIFQRLKFQDLEHGSGIPPSQVPALHNLISGHFLLSFPIPGKKLLAKKFHLSPILAPRCLYYFPFPCVYSIFNFYFRIFSPSPCYILRDRFCFRKSKPLFLIGVLCPDTFSPCIGLSMFALQKDQRYQCQKNIEPCERIFFVKKIR